jgi:hypothetical protein
MKKEQVMFEGQIYEVEFTEIAPSLYVYHNALPKEMRIIERVEDALAKPGTRFQWSPAQVGFKTIENSHRNCKD